MQEATRQPSVALVLGGASCLQEDISNYIDAGGRYDAVVACNDAGTVWGDELDAWVTLHPEKLATWAAARPSEYPACRRYMAHRKPKKAIDGVEVEKITITFDRQKSAGSSGLFAAKAALIDMAIDRVVFCGVPMQTTPHFFDAKAIPWKSATSFRKQWLTVPHEFRARMRSMSGWSRALLGGPTCKWE